MAAECWMFDLDGVVWLANDPIPGSAEALRRLRASGRHVSFFTNNSFSRRADLLAKFAAHDIECADEELFSSAEAAAYLMEPGERAYVLGGGGIEESLIARGGGGSNRSHLWWCASRRGRRRTGSVIAIRSTYCGMQSGICRGPAHRHERRRDLSDARGPTSRWWLASCGSCLLLGSHPDRRGKAL